ncbi:MAG: phosphotransferase enzyme family protein [Acidimicrobiia bacterium]
MTSNDRTRAEATSLLPLARRVLSQYPFQVREVDHLATHSNVLYRVITSSGQQLCLRVGAPHSNTRTNIEIEVAWLDALALETDLDVVRPVHTRSGDLIVDEFDPGLGQERVCVLFSWIPGVPLGAGSGAFGYRLMGQMSAALQQHGRHWLPPRVGRMRRWDRVFYYGLGLKDEVITDSRYSHLFTPSYRRVLVKAFDLAQDTIVRSWATGGTQVVHGDLHEWNVHVGGSRLYAFDFEDVMLALPAQDVAISLYSSRLRDNHYEIVSAFRRGYEEVAPWPVADRSQLEGFQAARQLMLMDYAARTLPTKEAEDYIQKVMPWLERYVRSYG